MENYRSISILSAFLKNTGKNNVYNRVYHTSVTQNAHRIYIYSHFIIYYYMSKEFGFQQKCSTELYAILQPSKEIYESFDEQKIY